MIAIVIPTYKSAAELTTNEKISLSQTTKVFGDYDVFLVTHSEINIDPYQSLAANKKKLLALFFEKNFFTSLEGYSKLLMSIEFYKAFESYQYLVICQLDVFTFYDNLKYYINKRIDYIGAPWFEEFDKAKKNSRIIGVGNGGFSLRKVSSFIKVLNILNVFHQPVSISFSAIIDSLLHPVSFSKVYRNQFLYKRKNNFSLVPSEFPFYEDIFWGSYVRPSFPWFKLGNLEDAITFCFEVNSELLYKMNNNQLPMATHAWEKYNRKFWTPIIESYGYQLDSQA